jgi:hypothetical protein
VTDDPFYEVSTDEGVGRVWPELRNLENLLIERGSKIDSNQAPPPTAESQSTQLSRSTCGYIFDLLSGRKIYIDSFDQYRIGSTRSRHFFGMLGKDLRTPALRCQDELRWQLSTLIDLYCGKPFLGDPYIIPPLDMRGSELPTVRCVGQFTSDGMDRGGSYDYSGLIVVWFQADFAFPIDPKVLSHIISLDWERYAAGMWY